MLLVGTIPAFYVVLNSAVRQHQWRLRTTADERKTWYYDWLLTARETAAELRLFALGDYFETAYRSLRRRLRGERLELTRQQSVAEFGAAVFALASSGGAIAWMGWKAVRGLVSPGDLAMFYQAFQQGLGLMNALLTNVGQIYASSLFLGGLFEFLALRPEVADPPSPCPIPRQTGDRGPLSRRLVPLSRNTALCSRWLRSHSPCWLDRCHCRAERRGQEHLVEAAVPLLRS